MERPVTRPRYVAIFGAMRTGSNLLERSIATLSDTACFGEAFNPGFIGEPRGYEIPGWDVARRDGDPLGFLDALRAEAGSRMAVFRIFQDHNSTVADHALADPECCRIVLTRDPVESFVSLEIARETGQWLLKNPRRRMAARVAFDPRRFTAYRERLAAFYAGIDARLARAGTTALRLDYDALGAPGTAEQVARHLGSIDPATGPADILRQNPGALAEKVTNYAEMCAFLGRMPEAVPEPDSALVGPGDLLVPPNMALAAVPLWGAGYRAAVSLLYRYERRFHDGPSIGHGQLMELAETGALFPVPEDLPDGCGVFAIHCHPAERLHGLFVEELFGAHWQTSVLRQRIAATLGDLPSPRDLSGAAVLPETLHRAAFGAFLDLIEAATRGDGPVPMRPAFAAQATLLDACAGTASLDAVFALDTLAEAEAWMAARTGLPGLPAKHVADVATWARGTPRALDNVRTEAISARIRALHGADFARFGYGDWPAGA